MPAQSDAAGGDGIVMLSDEWPDMGKLVPKARGEEASSMRVDVEDVGETQRWTGA